MRKSRQHDHDSEKPAQPQRKLKRSFEAKGKNQTEYVLSIIKNDITFCSGPSGTGKAQPLDSLVYTPDGPKKMGDIKVGDEVCTPSGKTANVIAIHPQGFKNVYQINFKNGNLVRCCEDHLWKVDINNGKDWKSNQVIDLKEIKNNKLHYLNKGNKRYKFRVKSSKIVFFKERKIELDPYLLGVLLGDGGLTQNVYFTCHPNDIEIPNNIKTILNDYEDVNLVKHVDIYSYGITTEKGKNNPIRDALNTLGIMGKKSENKFIPNDYKYNSLENRIKLIRGLMDTDGTIDNKGKIEFSSSSFELAQDVKEVLQSLGCIVSFNTKKTTHLDHHRLYIKDCENVGLFNLKRKRDKQVDLKKGFDYHYIKDINELGEEECQCITIDSDDSLYLTNNLIPTHNSFISAGIASQHLLKGKTEKLIVTRPLVTAGASLGAVPGDIQEKVRPYLKPMEENLRYFLGDENFDELLEQDVIRFEPLELMRGASYHNSYMILDEAQNCTLKQIKMFITRIGENSKVLINGDVDQTDLKRDSGLHICVSKLSQLKGVGVCELTDDDIQRNPIIKSVLMALKDENIYD